MSWLEYGALDMSEGALCPVVDEKAGEATPGNCSHHNQVHPFDEMGAAGGVELAIVEATCQTNSVAKAWRCSAGPSISRVWP